MRWNQAQQQAIKQRNKNILVSAAAGSGKTAVLTERIKQLIVKDGVGIDKMLIVTFTNAAAGEMRERIIKAISEELRAGGSAFLREQLAKIHNASISTFHAFCIDIIRKYFYLIDVRADAKICDETQKAILQSEAMEELFEKRFAEQEEGFRLFLHKYADSRNEDQVKAMILAVYQFIQSIPEPFEWLEEKIENLRAGADEFCFGETYRHAADQIGGELRRARGYMDKVLAVVEEQGIESVGAKARKDIDVVSRLSEIWASESHDDFAGTVKSVKFETFSSKKEEREAFESIKEEVKFLRDKGKGAVKTIAEKYMAKHLEGITEENKLTYDDAKCLQSLVVQFSEIYGQKKEQRGLIDFHDAEHFALRILEDSRATDEYKKKFDYIFIDEYQDSNVVQDTLISRIKRKNNLFMVGDVKQSIYRFRLADPEIFIEKYEQYKNQEQVRNEDRNKSKNQGDSVKIDLNQNFRSKSGMIDFINLIFEQIMTKSTCGIDYDEGARLYKGLEYDGPLSYQAEIHLVDETSGDAATKDKSAGYDTADEIDEAIAEMKKTELEASVAAKLIKETVGTPVFDEKKGVQRNTSYRDIVVLFRAIKSAGAIYQEIFEKEGIPVFAELDDGYFDTMEIGTFLNLLMVIDNKRQDLPLLSVLRSGIFGFGSDELVEIRLINKNVPYHEAFLQAAAFAAYFDQDSSYDSDLFADSDIFGACGAYALSSSGALTDQTDGRGEAGIEDEIVNAEQCRKLCIKCKEALQKIEEWLRLSQIMPLDEFIWTLMNESGYYEYVSAMPGGAQRKANLRALADKANAYQSGQAQGLFGFIRYALQLQKSGITVGQVRLLGESDDVVRLMTVHKSKGLEFPVVIVAGLGRRFNIARDSYKVNLHRQIGVALRYVRPEDFAWQKTFAQEVIEQCEKKEVIAEEMRILYVALTRAKDRLFLLGSLKDADKAMKKYELKGNLDPASAMCFFDWIIPAAWHGGIYPVFYNRSDISAQKEEAGRHKELIVKGIREGFFIAHTEKNASMKKEIERKLFWQYPHRKATGMPSKYTVSEINRIRSGDAGRDIPDILLPEELADGSNRLTAAQRGTAMHSVLQRLDMKKPADVQSIRKQVAKMAEREILTAEEADAINCGKIAAMLSSPVGRRMKNAGEIYREVTFNIKKPVRDITQDQDDPEEEVLIQGAIDCYFQEGGKYILLDYKTDRIIGEQSKREQGEMEEEQASPAVKLIIEKYRPQLHLYKEAVETVKQISIDEVYLYLFAIDCGVKIRM